MAEASISRQVRPPARPAAEKIAREPSVEPLSAKMTSQGWSHSWAATPSRVSASVRSSLRQAITTLIFNTILLHTRRILPRPGGPGSTRGPRQGNHPPPGAPPRASPGLPGPRPTHRRPPSLSWRGSPRFPRPHVLPIPPPSRPPPPSAAPSARSSSANPGPRSRAAAPRRSARRAACRRRSASAARAHAAPAGRGRAGPRARPGGAGRSGCARARPSSPRRLAILTARARGWTAAAPLFAAPAAARTPGAAASLLRGRPAPAADLALPAPGGPADLDPATAATLVVYTTAFGTSPTRRRSSPRSPACASSASPTGPSRWRAGRRCRRRAARPPAAPAPAAAWCRIRPDLALAEAAPGGARPRSISRPTAGWWATSTRSCCAGACRTTWRSGGIRTGSTGRIWPSTRWSRGARRPAVIAQAEACAAARRCRATAAPGTPG